MISRPVLSGNQSLQYRLLIIDNNPDLLKMADMTVYHETRNSKDKIMQHTSIGKPS